jgi:hypothetical protein
MVTCSVLAFTHVQTQTCGLHYEIFTIIIYNYNDSMIIIYNHNDSGQYYKAMILANLALARGVRYAAN